MSNVAFFSVPSRTLRDWSLPEKSWWDTCKLRSLNTVKVTRLLKNKFNLKVWGRARKMCENRRALDLKYSILPHVLRTLHLEMNCGLFAFLMRGNLISILIWYLTFIQQRLNTQPKCAILPGGFTIMNTFYTCLELKSCSQFNGDISRNPS